MSLRQRARQTWVAFWMARAGRSRIGRLAYRFGAILSPPYKARVGLAHRFPAGYIAPSTHLSHRNLQIGQHVFIGDQVVIDQRHNAGPVVLGDYVELHRDVIIENGAGGRLSIGERTGVQPRCQFSAYVAPIEIGRRVQIAPACAFYPYDHGMQAGRSMSDLPLTSKGPIIIEDEAWLGYGVIVLSGVRIGSGAVIGAGSVVVRDIPAGAIAVGNPARVVRMRVAGEAPEHVATEQSLPEESSQ
jgi:acetyltransferase-like isoleucine patch superfamily enzyme